MPPPPLTAEVLAALQRIGCPVTTTDIMRLLNRGRSTPLVIDQVYRALEALRARGVVQRLKSSTNKRVRYWEVAAAPSDCTCGAIRQATS